MRNVKNDKKNKINDIVSIVKVSSLLFIGIILCRTFNTSISAALLDMKECNQYVFFCVPMIIIILTYYIWTFSNKNKIYTSKSTLSNIETSLFIVIFSVIILICGLKETQYKLLYLFIIITTTIQFGMKQGLIALTFATFIILAMDILLIPSTEVSNYFQDDLILAGVFFLTAWPLGFYVKIENQHIEKLESLINIDWLTELNNHGYFCEILMEKRQRVLYQ